MDNDNMRQPISVNEEIKALLILLLLKGGTPSDEIETALRIASGDYRLERTEPDLTCPFVHAKVQAMSAKAKLRNEQLAPLQCYAA
ncbi:MAG: hypothetical protein K2W78_07470 [Xanthobacteraceae bacterium]|nr:hypothetical protein [Xanthobacteraceae bacterium]